MSDIEQMSAESATGRSIRSSSIALLDDIDVALYALDIDGRCVRLNRACERLLGFTEAQALGQNMHALVHHHHEDGRPFDEANCPLAQASRHYETRRDLAITLWSAHGSAVQVECSTSPVALPDGSKCTVVTMKDVRGRVAAEIATRKLESKQVETVRQLDASARAASEMRAEVAGQQRLHAAAEKAATDQIREQQALLGMVAEVAPVGIAVFDSHVCYRWTNESYVRSMDPVYQGQVLQGNSFFDTLPAGNREEMRRIVGGVRSTGKTFVAENYALEGVGRGTTYWRWSLSQLENGDLMSTAADVTEQVNARREVEAVYANAPIALSLLDAKTLCYLRVNLEYARVLGVPPEALVGQRAGTFSSSPGAAETLAQVCGGSVIQNSLLELRAFADPGSEKFVLLNATPNCSEAGAVETISVALTDVTAQKRAENALVQADKLAAVGRLAASISHEINNPLEAVTNLLYLVHQDPALSTESCGYVEQAEEELKRVSQIASQTLRFQRHAVKAVPVTARQLIDPVVAMYQGRLKHTRIEVSVDHRGEPETVVVFEGDVRQILNNLIGNAIDATAGGGKITVRTRPACCVHTRRRGTRISIADSGHGMSKETAAHIFEPFYTTKGSAGSGLGLWISHTLAHRHGGQLGVRSRKASSHPSGKSGTVFSLFLPNLELGEEPGK